MTAFLEKALSFVWAIYDLQGAILVDVTVNLAFLYLQTALVFAWYYRLWAIILYVFFHLIKPEGKTALKEAFNDAEGAFLIYVMVEISSQDHAARPLEIIIRVDIVIGAGQRGERADLQVLVNLTFPDYLVAVIVRARDRKLKDEPPDWDIWLESFGGVDSQVTEWASWGTFDALFAEEVMTARGLHSILIDIKANWAEPSIIRET